MDKQNKYGIYEIKRSAELLSLDVCVRASERWAETLYFEPAGGSKYLF